MAILSPGMAADKCINPFPPSTFGEKQLLKIAFLVTICCDEKGLHRGSSQTNSSVHER